MVNVNIFNHSLVLYISKLYISQYISDYKSDYKKINPPIIITKHLDVYHPNLFSLKTHF